MASHVDIVLTHGNCKCLPPLVNGSDVGEHLRSPALIAMAIRKLIVQKPRNNNAYSIIGKDIFGVSGGVGTATKEFCR